MGAGPFLCRGDSMKDNSIGVEIVNFNDVVKGLDLTSKAVVKAVNNTVKDFKSRGPGWISKEVRSNYTIKPAEVKSSFKGSSTVNKIMICGVSVDNVELIYRGKPLTPIHFQMTPKARPTNPRRKYNINVTIYKGRKKQIHDAFLGDNGHGTDIPWQRITDTRLPIKSVKTVSVPQMITGETSADNVSIRINKELIKRLNHHIERANR